MRYTKEQIQQMREDPSMRLLSLMCGIPFEELLEDLTKQLNKEEQVKPKQERKEPTQEKVITRPLDEQTYAYIVKCAVALNESILKMRQSGFDVNTKDLTLVGAPVSIIYALLTRLVGAGFAGRFVAGIPDGDEKYFKQIYDNTIPSY